MEVFKVEINNGLDGVLMIVSGKYFKGGNWRQGFASKEETHSKIRKFLKANPPKREFTDHEINFAAIEEIQFLSYAESGFGIGYTGTVEVSKILVYHEWDSW